MASLRDELEELLGPHDLEAEMPSAPSLLRREEPKRLPISQAVQQCAVGAVLAATKNGERLVVAGLESGEIVVLADLCPHDGGLLSDGYIDGGMVVCARHGWEFDGRTGVCATREGVSVPCFSSKPPHI